MTGDGIFDKITNEEVIKQSWIAAKRNFKSKDQPIHQICGNIVEQVMKDSIAYKTLDNITVVLLAFNNLRQSLVDELLSQNYSSDVDDKDQVGGSRQEDQQSVSNEQTSKPPGPNQNEKLDNSDSSNGGLIYSENKEVTNITNEEICKRLNLPNFDVTLYDVEVMRKKPRMPMYNHSSKTIHSMQSNQQDKRMSR